MQEKETIISVRYEKTNLSEPRDAKTVTLGTDLSVRTSHSCQILIVFDDYSGKVMFTRDPFCFLRMCETCLKLLTIDIVNCKVFQNGPLRRNFLSRTRGQRTYVLALMRQFLYAIGKTF